MGEEKKQFFKCSECGGIFDSEELLKDHFKVKHSSKTYVGPATEGKSWKDHLKKIKPFLNTSFAAGFILGILTLSAILGGAAAYDSYTGPEALEVTVVTCDNCSYERFTNATDRMFKVNYNEVDYKSDEGQELVEKYDLNYVPGFIYDGSVTDRENFTQVGGSLVKMNDSYVLSDANNQAAQRFSEGISLN